MKGLKVSQITKSLGVSKVTVYKKLKQLKVQLKGKTYKENGILFLTNEAVSILQKNLTGNLQQGAEHNKQATVNSVNQSKLEIILYEQLARKNQEMDQKNETINKQDETIKQLINKQVKSEEKLQTIIMKLTQDLEQTRKQIENKTITKIETKEDKVISIEKFANAKIEKHLEKKNYEDPLHGKSALYKFYIKMFHPEKLRKHA